MLLQDRVAIVTGAGRGIGRAIAGGLAKEGATVVAVDLVLDGARETVRLIEEAGGQGFAQHVDVADSALVQEMVDATLNRYGAIDILVNDAGIAPVSTLMDMAEEEWSRVIAVNLTGTFLCTQAVVKHMVPRRSGRIISVASSRGIYGDRNRCHYSASKAGIIAFTKSIAYELAPHGITVNAIAPGRTDTPMSRAYGHDAEIDAQRATGQVGLSEDLVPTVVFLASDMGYQITGHTIVRETYMAR